MGKEYICCGKLECTCGKYLVENNPNAARLTEALRHITVGLTPKK